MHAFRRYEYRNIVCHKLRKIQDALSHKANQVIVLSKKHGSLKIRCKRIGFAKTSTEFGRNFKVNASNPSLIELTEYKC